MNWKMNLFNIDLYETQGLSLFLLFVFWYKKNPF